MNRRLSSWIFLAAAACSSSGEPPASTRADSVEPSPSTAAADPLRRGPIVTFVGTSLTAGLGLLRAEDTYVARVGELADSAGLPIQPVNAGVSGDTSAGGLRRIDWVLEQPVDVLVVELGANDGLRGQDPDATERNLLEIVRRARGRHPDVRVVIAGMEAPPNLGATYTGRFHDIFPDVARETGAALVPFLLEGVAGVPELNQSDGIHPTPEGHRILAHTVWSVLEPVVRAWYADHPESGAADR